MKRILFFAMAVLFCLSISVEVDAQGFTGARKFTTKTALDAYTPNVTQNQAMIGLVTSGSNVSTLYVWDQVSGSWISSGSLTVTDGTTIDFTYNSGTGALTAELSQNGATTDQVLQWDGSDWVPVDLIAGDIAINDPGSLITATEVEGALQELAIAIDATFSVAGEYNSDAAAGTGGVPLSAFYTAGSAHVDGVRQGTAIKRIN